MSMGTNFSAIQCFLPANKPICRMASAITSKDTKAVSPPTRIGVALDGVVSGSIERCDDPDMREPLQLRRPKQEQVTALRNCGKPFARSSPGCYCRY